MKTANILWRDLLCQVRLFPLALLTLTALPLAAQVPSLINYQGRLTDGSGSPATGNRTMAVSVYDAANGGNLTYSESLGTVSVANGTYNFQFGASGNGIVSALSGQDFLALTVNGTEETTRTRLLAVPFALKAKESADTQALNTRVTSLNGTVAGLSASQTTLAGNITTLQAQTQSVNATVSGLLAQFRVVGLSVTLAFGNSTNNGTLEISNSGFGRLAVSGISYPAGFSGNWSSGIIDPGQSQSVALTFSPTAVQSYSGNISVTSDATSGTGAIAVSGQGTRLISLSGDLSFGNGTINVLNQRNFRIANTGTMDLSVSGITYPSGFSGNWSGTLAPGGSQIVTAFFTPTAVQSYGGNLSVASNATGGSGSLVLSGIGRTAGPTGSMVTVAGGTLPQGSGLAGQTVATFDIGKYEVTWGEWKEVRAWALANGYTDLAGVGGTYPDGAADNFPVINVSWYEAVKWMNAKSEKDGLSPVYQVSGATYKTGQSAPTSNSEANGYRLPSEKEWEWAARGGASSQGYAYSGSSDVTAVAWYVANSSDGSKAVGTKVANELAICDMSGNVLEFCKDDFGNGTGSKCIRGGSWDYSADYCTVAYRGIITGPDDRSNSVGFRLARSSGN
jgi:formylglycine-generating enzyme required for sulfatase activity